MSGTDRPDRKLVIAAESLCGAEAALAFCRTLLESLPARPAGLIIEPGSTGFLAGGTRNVVSTGGAVMAVPSPDRLRRIASGDARAFRVRLAGLATALNIPWTCDLSAGDLVSVACSTAEGEDILLLGQRPILRQRGKVLLVAAEHGPSEEARNLAEALARASSTLVSVCPPGGRPEPDDLVGLVDRSHAGAVVVDLDAGPLRTRDDLRRVFAAARCTVAVLGASRTRLADDDAAHGGASSSAAAGASANTD